MLASFVPTSTLGTIGVWGLIVVGIGNILLALVKDRPALKRIQVEEDSSLRETLLGRVETLEKRIEAMTAQHAAKEELHAAELALVRHRMNNESASMDALVGMLEANPNIPPETIKRITDSRARAAEAFATEMNAITMARIALAQSVIEAVKEDKA